VSIYTLALCLLAARGGLWGDEGFTAGMVRLPWRTMVADLAHIDVNMGAYYAVVKVVTGLVGSTGEVALRLVSVLATAGSVALVARSAVRWLGHRSGTTAAVVFAVHPFTVVLAVTARPYALLVFGGLVSAAAVLRAIERRRPLDWSLWVLAAGLLLYVHLLGALIIAAQALYAVLRLRGSDRRSVAGALGASAALAVAAIPTVVFIAPADTLAWVAPVTLRSGIGVAETVAGGRLFGVVLIGFAALGAARLARRRSPHPGLVISLLTIPVLAVLALLPVQSLLIDFYLAPVIAPICLLAAHGIGLLADLRWRLGAGTALLAAATVSTGPGIADGTLAAPQDWRAAGPRLAALVGPEDLVGFPDAFYRIVAEYYPNGAVHDRAGATIQDDWRVARPVLPVAAWGSLRPYQLDRIKRLGLQSAPNTVADQVGTARSVWLVGPDEPALQIAVATLTGRGHRVVETVRLHGVTLVHLSS
jgi:mannosyltransferase